MGYLVLSEEQRRARNLSGHFGIRALAGVYLGCVLNPTHWINRPNIGRNLCWRI